MKLINEYEFEMKYSEVQRSSSVLGLIMDNGRVNIIDFIYDKKENAYICSSNSASIEDFKFSKKELFRLPNKQVTEFSIFSSSNASDSDSGAAMIVNQDQTAFAITVDIVDKSSETHKIYLYDSSLNKKLDHTFIRKIKDRKFKYENINVSNDGNTLYLLGKAKTAEKKKKKDGGQYQYELTKITKDTEKTQIFDTEEHYAGSLKAVIHDGRLTCVGFYSDRNDSRYKGISYFELDPETLEIRKSKYNPFTEQFMIDKYGKDKDKELRNLAFRGMMISASGNIVFNAEEYYVVNTYMATPNGGGTWRTSYHYNDIVSAKLNPDGDLVWARNINKRQSTSGDGAYLSYTSTIKGDDTYFFINTGEKVKKLSKDRIQFGQTSAKKSNMNIIRINRDGDFDFQEILDDKENEVPFMVSWGALSTDINNVVFLGRKGKKKQLLKITL